MRRLAAILSLLSMLIVAVATVLYVIDEPGPLVAVVVLFGVVIAAGWYAITREGAARWTAIVVVAISVVAFLVALVVGDEGWSLVWRGVLVVLAVLLGRYATERDVTTLKQSPTPGVPVGPAQHGVLIMNPKSGGGKAERFHLEDECRRRGIEPVVLQRGDDLLVLARDAIARGADVIGMAGGDGSQALVASIAAEADVPMVVIPAGTRNHLALDLGIDRNDVVGALDAFGDAFEQRVDLADMNGKVFVNNVSLGLYASIVESPEYRDAKVDTALSALPTLLGPNSTPVDLRFDVPDGPRVDGVHVVQVSNGPYGTTMLTLTSRPRLDSGKLGITALVLPDDHAGRRFLHLLGLGHPERYEGYHSWESPTFEIESGAPVAIGLDGETMTVDPPLLFTVRPGVLRLRRAPTAIGASPAALRSGWRGTLRLVWQTALHGSARSPS